MAKERESKHCSLQLRVEDRSLASLLDSRPKKKKKKKKGKKKKRKKERKKEETTRLDALQV